MRLILIMMVAGLLAGCSLENAIENMASEQELALGKKLAITLCSGNMAEMQDDFHPEVWKKSEPIFPQAKSYCPKNKNNPKVIGYHTHLNTDNRKNQAEITLVNEDAENEFWTTTQLKTNGNRENPQIIFWNINGATDRPALLDVADTARSTLKWVAIVIPLFLLLSLTFVVWFYRRSKRKQRQNLSK